MKWRSKALAIHDTASADVGIEPAVTAAMRTDPENEPGVAAAAFEASEAASDSPLTPPASPTSVTALAPRHDRTHCTAAQISCYDGLSAVTARPGACATLARSSACTAMQRPVAAERIS